MEPIRTFRQNRNPRAFNAVDAAEADFNGDLYPPDASRGFRSRELEIKDWIEEMKADLRTLERARLRQVRREKFLRSKRAIALFRAIDKASRPTAKGRVDASKLANLEARYLRAFRAIK